MIQELRKRLIGCFGRRGTVALGLLVAAGFVMGGGPFFLAGAGSSLVALVIFTAILVGPAAWVLSDARQRGMQRPFFWALFALLGNIFAVIVYLLVRDEHPTQQPCTACSRPVSSTHTACPWCGTLRSASVRTCATCRNELEVDWRFCPYCRTEVGRASPTA